MNKSPFATLINLQVRRQAIALADTLRNARWCDPEHSSIYVLIESAVQSAKTRNRMDVYFRAEAMWRAELSYKEINTVADERIAMLRQFTEMSPTDTINGLTLAGFRAEMMRTEVAAWHVVKDALEAERASAIRTAVDISREAEKPA